MAQKLDLYNQVMNYLKQAMPDTFKYDRTPRIGIPTPVPSPLPPEPIKKLLPRPGGDNNNLAGNISPMDLTTDFSQITSDRQKRLSQDPTGLNKFLIDTLGMQRPQTAEDIVNLGYRTPSKFGITALLPDKYGELPRADQAFIESRMGYTGPTIFGPNNSGLSKDPFGLNTRSAFGNYAERVGVEAEKLGNALEKSAARKGLSFDPATGKVTGGTPAKRAAWEKQTQMLNTKFNFYTGEAADRKDYQDQVQNVLDADKEFSTEGDSSNYGINGYPTYDIKDIQGEDDEEFDPTDFTSIYTPKAPTYLNNYPTTITGSGDGTGSGGSYDEAGIDYGDGTGPGGSYDEAGIDYGDGTGPGGSYDEAGINTGGGYNAGSGYNATGKGGPAGQGSPKYGTGSGNLGDYQIQPSTPSYTPSPGDGGEGGNNNSGGKIVCTMMNESYGFGSFRNKIWLKHSKGLAPEYQKGYHKLFLPLVKIAKTNKVVRKILEHIAVHRTIDIRQESRGKVHLLGRVYRKILEPLCYFVGKHG